MSRPLRMGTEVSQIAGKLHRILGCSTCATGIAIDIVGQRWGEPEYDWAGANFGHECAITRGGVPAEKLPQIKAVQDGLGAWAARQNDGASEQVEFVDSRLPREREEATQ